MRKILVLAPVILLPFFFLAPQAHAAPAVQQTCAGEFDNGTPSINMSSTCTFGSNATAGDFLLDYYFGDVQVPTSTMISGCASSWNIIATSTTQGGNAAEPYVALLEGVVASTGSCTITAWSAGNNAYNISAYDISGASTNIDGYSLGYEYDGYATQTTPIIPTITPNDLVIVSRWGH